MRSILRSARLAVFLLEQGNDVIGIAGRGASERIVFDVPDILDHEVAVIEG